MKKWSSQWKQFMQLRKEAWKKFRTSPGFEPVTSRLPMQCSTNWAMKPLTLGAGQLWVHMFRWKKWVLMIYEKNHIWTAEMKWKWRNDRRSERNLCKCVKKSEKKIQDFNGVWTRWSPGSRSFSFLHFYSLLVLFFTTFLYVIARSRVRTPLRSWIFFRLLYAIA